MNATDELVSSTLSLSCNELLAESPSTSSSHVPERSSRRRSNRIVLGAVNTNQAGKRLSHGNARKRQSTDNCLNFPFSSSVGTLPDRAISTDPRVLQNLRNAEMALAVNSHYFSSIQENIQPMHREQAVDWLYDVSKEERCDVDVFPLAVSIMDRYLSTQNIFNRDVQAVAGVCLFIASKLKAPMPMNADRVAYYTADSISANDVLSWELIILHTLEWDLSAPTAFDFFDQMVSRMPAVGALRDSFTNIVHQIQKNVKLGMLPPSMQCAISLLYAAECYTDFTHTLNNASELALLVTMVLGVDPVIVKGLMPQMDRALLGLKRPSVSPAAPPSSCRTPSPQQGAHLVAQNSSNGLVTPHNDSGFCSGASSPESAKKPEMECSPPKSARLV